MLMVFDCMSKVGRIHLHPKVEILNVFLSRSAKRPSITIYQQPLVSGITPSKYWDFPASYIFLFLDRTLTPLARCCDTLIFKISTRATHY